MTNGRIGLISYQFPHLHMFDGMHPCSYTDKIREESLEVLDAFDSAKCYRDCPSCSMTMTYDVAMEIMDVMQACETALRNSGLSEEQLAKIYDAHNAKDAARGYQDVQS